MIFNLAIKSSCGPFLGPWLRANITRKKMSIHYWKFHDFPRPVNRNPTILRHFQVLQEPVNPVALTQTRLSATRPTHNKLYIFFNYLL